MSTIRDIDDKGKIVESQPEQSHESEYNVSAPSLPEIEISAISDVLGLERKELTKYSDELQLLLKYAKKESSDGSPENLKWAIRSLELKLGTPPLAERRVKYLARYAYLLQEESKIQKEKQSFERKF